MMWIGDQREDQDKFWELLEEDEDRDEGEEVEVAPKFDISKLQQADGKVWSVSCA